MHEILDQFRPRWESGDEDIKTQAAAAIIGLTGRYWGKNAINGMDMSEIDEWVVEKVFGKNADMMSYVIKTYKELTSNKAKQ